MSGRYRHTIKVYNPSRTRSAVGDYYQSTPAIGSEGSTEYRCRVTPKTAQQLQSADETVSRQFWLVEMRKPSSSTAIKVDTFIEYESEMYIVKSFTSDQNTQLNVIQFEMVKSDGR